MELGKIEALGRPLAGKLALVTGGGGGIGLEAAKAFLALGARVIVAEVDGGRCRRAKAEFAELRGEAEVRRVDLADGRALAGLVAQVLREGGCPDVVLNNAATVPTGAVEEVPPKTWDLSYRVNLRAPLSLARGFLPAMRQRGSGTLVFVSSSGASPYMGAYEVFKTAQAELATTLAMELEGSGIHSFCIGPGLVKTDTALEAMGKIAARMGLGLADFLAMNGRHTLDAASAGLGFALSVLDAERLHGQEVGSIQVLRDHGLEPSGGAAPPEAGENSAGDSAETMILLERVHETYQRQFAGWRAMNIFERQWVLRDLKRHLGRSAEEVSACLGRILDLVRDGGALGDEEKALLRSLQSYWRHQLTLLGGFEKDRGKLEEHTLTLEGWILDLERLVGRTPDPAGRPDIIPAQGRK